VKKFVGLSVVLLLAGCGMSEGEKQQLASSTCNVISNAAGDDSTTRLKELNSAREQLGEALYTGSDDDIRDSVKFGICESLVLNDPAYGSLITQNREMVAAEKKRIDGIAAVTCSVMGETRNMDAAVRIKEMNAARVEIGEEPFLDGDEAIKQSFKYGLCEALVKNEPNYSEMLAEMKRIEREAIAAQRQREREEAERLAREKEEKERVPRQKWRAAMEADLQDASLEFISASYDDQNVRLEIKYTCQPIDGFRRDLVVVFKNNLGTLTGSNSIGACGYNGRQTDTFYSFSGIEDDLEDALYGTSDSTRFIKEIYVLIKGVYSVSPRDRMRRLDPNAYPPLGEYSELRKPIRINVKM
jgi:hypothetical protein